MVHKKILKSKIVYKNPYFRVRKDTVLLSCGKKNNWYSVDKSPFVVIVALTNKNEIYLVGQWRYTIKNYSWELPAGNVDKNENLFQAAKRELQEETGLQAKKWKYLGFCSVGVGTYSEIFYIFLARNLIQGKKNFSETEELKVKKNSLKEVNKLIKKNKIFDGPTISALYKFGLNKKYGKNF